MHEPPANALDLPPSTLNNGAAGPDVPKETATVVRVERVTKRFGSVGAVRNVSLRIGPGEVYGLLGSNGAGKSTLLKLLLGFLYPDKGSIKLFGSTNLTAAHSRLGYLPEKARYHGNFSGREYLQFHARLSGYTAKDSARIANYALQIVGLHNAANRRIKTYSKGMAQRLGMAVVLSGSGGEPPELLVLDEPASGLDPEGQVAIRDFILHCRDRGSTVLLCSHQLTEVEKICSTVGIMRAGKLVAQTNLTGGSRAIITGLPRVGAMEIAPALLSYLSKLHPTVLIKGGHSEGEALMVNLPAGPEVLHSAAIKAAAIKAMLDGRWDITSLYTETKDIESLYMRAVQSPAQRNGAKEGDTDTTTPSTAQDGKPTRTGNPTSPLPSLET